jgi:hypothetical protein
VYTFQSSPDIHNLDIQKDYLFFLSTLLVSALLNVTSIDRQALLQHQLIESDTSLFWALERVIV